MGVINIMVVCVRLFWFKKHLKEVGMCDPSVPYPLHQLIVDMLQLLEFSRNNDVHSSQMRRTPRSNLCKMIAKRVPFLASQVTMTRLHPTKICRKSSDQFLQMLKRM